LAFLNRTSFLTWSFSFIFQFHTAGRHPWQCVQEERIVLLLISAAIIAQKKETSKSEAIVMH
jgi:hypothetical protein